MKGYIDMNYLPSCALVNFTPKVTIQFKCTICEINISGDNSSYCLDCENETKRQLSGHFIPDISSNIESYLFLVDTVELERIMEDINNYYLILNG